MLIWLGVAIFVVTWIVGMTYMMRYRRPIPKVPLYTALALSGACMFAQVLFFNK